MQRASLTSIMALLVVSACSGGPTSAPSATVSVTTLPTAVPTAPPTAALKSAIIGDWTRLVSCEESLAAFVAAGLTDQVGQWVVDNFVPAGASASPGHECDNANPPAQHSHFFTGAGRFGSRDENGQQVDNGDYVLVDSSTLSFPSHAHEFGYNGDLIVGFAISGDKLTFTIQIPSSCSAECRVAYGWAMSAFYGPQPFQRTIT